MPEPLVIVEGVRTPFCKAGSELAGLAADELGRIAVDALLTRTGFDPALVDEVIFGCVCQPVDAPNVARVIALRAGLPETVPAATVHRNCASGFEAVTTAAERLRSGHGSIFIVGGTESMSRVPLLYPEAAARKFALLSRARTVTAKMAALSAFRPGDFKPLVALKMGLTDPISGLNMGETAEVLAREFSISRERQDQFALRSHELAVAARAKLFGYDLVAVPWLAPEHRTLDSYRAIAARLRPALVSAVLLGLLARTRELRIAWDESDSLYRAAIDLAGTVDQRA